MARTESTPVRLLPEEKEALVQLAERLGVKPSRVHRRLIREALTGGPDYFDTELAELKKFRGQLLAIGRNINQLTKLANQGEGVVPSVLRDDLADAKRVIDGASRLYLQAIERVTQRSLRKAHFRTVSGGES